MAPFWWFLVVTVSYTLVGFVVVLLASRFNRVRNDDPYWGDLHWSLRAPRYPRLYRVLRFIFRPHYELFRRRGLSI